MAIDHTQVQRVSVFRSPNANYHLPHCCCSRELGENKVGKTRGFAFITICVSRIGLSQGRAWGRG